MRDSEKCMSVVTTCGGLLGAIAFMAAVLTNALRGLDFSMYFLKALSALFVGYGAGCVFGLIGFGIVHESFAKPEAIPPPVADDVVAEPITETPAEKPKRPRKR